MASHSELEIGQLRAFVTLVEHGRVTAAARALQLAQSTVSEALAALERVLGAQLAVRARGSYSLRLTTAGEALLPHARAVLAAVDNAHAAVVATTRSARTRVDIVANESTSTYVLPRAIAALRERWPMTRFSVSVAACSSVRENVAAAGFDVGLLLEWEGEFDDGRILLHEVPLVVFARPVHPLVHRASGRAIPRPALGEFPVFVTDAAGEFHVAVRRFLTEDRLGASTIEAIGSVEGVKRAVMADADALGLLPAFAVADELRLGSIARLQIQPAPPRMQLAARFPPGRPRHPAAEALVEILRRSSNTPKIRRIS